MINEPFQFVKELVTREIEYFIENKNLDSHHSIFLQAFFGECMERNNYEDIMNLNSNFKEPNQGSSDQIEHPSKQPLLAVLLKMSIEFNKNNKTIKNLDVFKFINLILKSVRKIPFLEKRIKFVSKMIRFDYLQHLKML